MYARHTVALKLLANLSKRDSVELFRAVFAGKEVFFVCATLLHGTDWSGVNGYSGAAR
jgi:hypothetical protein